MDNKIIYSCLQEIIFPKLNSRGFVYQPFQLFVKDSGNWTFKKKVGIYSEIINIYVTFDNVIEGILLTDIPMQLHKQIKMSELIYGKENTFEKAIEIQTAMHFNDEWELKGILIKICNALEEKGFSLLENLINQPVTKAFPEKADYIYISEHYSKYRETELLDLKDMDYEKQYLSIIRLTDNYRGKIFAEIKPDLMRIAMLLGNYVKNTFDSEWIWNKNRFVIKKEPIPFDALSLIFSYWRDKRCIIPYSSLKEGFKNKKI